MRTGGVDTSSREAGEELSSLRVMLVEDFQWFRAFVRAKLEQRAELHLVCEVSDGLQPIESAKKLRPDLILLDIGLLSLSGIEVARRIRELVPHSKIILLSQETTPNFVREAIALGAWGTSSSSVLKATCYQQSTLPCPAGNM